MITEIGSSHASYEEDLEHYRTTEKILVSLVSGCRFDVKAAEICIETEHDQFLIEKREEMFDHLLDLLRKA